MKPDITLILPVKNEDKILFKNINNYKRKIESITKKKIIIITVLNGSSDNSEHLSNSFPMPEILVAFFSPIKVTKSTFTA